MLERVAVEQGCNKRMAKKILTSVYFGEWERELQSDFASRVDAEATVIQKELMKQPELGWVVESVRGQKNMGGKFLSRAYQSIESKLTLAACAELAEQNIHVQCLEFDGFAIPRSCDLSQAIRICVESSERLCPGMGMEWVEKPLDYTLRDKATETEIGEFVIEFDADVTIKKQKVKVRNVLLVAHNATYDWQCLIPHLCRIRFINRGTSLVCGSARYYRPGWLSKDGKAKTPHK